MPSFTLRPARAESAETLNRLILRSKAHWGYDDAMMALMAQELRVDPAALTAGRVMAAWRGETPLGVAQVCEPVEDARGRAMELYLLFIAPDAIGTGLGRVLYDWAVSQALGAGCVRLDILSDPNAEAFYVAMGAVKVEDRPSTVVPGRMLPVLEHRLA